MPNGVYPSAQPGPPAPGGDEARRDRTTQVVVALLTTVGVVVAAVWAASIAFDGVTKQLKRNSRQTTAQYLRTERRRAYAKFIADERILRGDEQALVHDGGPQEEATAKAQYSKLAGDRLDLQVIAPCQTRNQAITLVFDHYAYLVDARRGADYHSAADAIHKAGGHLIVGAREDLARRGKTKIKRVCKPPALDTSLAPGLEKLAEALGSASASPA